MAELHETRMDFYFDDGEVDLRFRVKNHDRLSEVFSDFVEFTRMIGFSEKSWSNLISEISQECDENYSIFDFAADERCAAMMSE